MVESLTGKARSLPLSSAVGRESLPRKVPSSMLCGTPRGCCAILYCDGDVLAAPGLRDPQIAATRAGTYGACRDNASAGGNAADSPHGNEGLAFRGLEERRAGESEVLGLWSLVSELGLWLACSLDRPKRVRCARRRNSELRASLRSASRTSFSCPWACQARFSRLLICCSLKVILSSSHLPISLNFSRSLPHAVHRFLLKRISDLRYCSLSIR